MNDDVARRRRAQAAGLLLPLFFLSGATALGYQTLWVRELRLVFGTSTFAISTVLAVFMFGLAAGAFVMARYADRLARPLAFYGILEIGIGLYALIFPLLVSVLKPAYLAIWRAMEPGPLTFGLIQFLLVAIALLLPTAAMGATLPLLARFATRRLGAAGSRIGTLYAVNTFGAVAGTWFCGFLLLPQAGRFSTTIIAASANLILGVAAQVLDRWASRSHTGAVEIEDDLGPRRPWTPALVVVSIAIALAGFAALIYEVTWARLLGLMLGGSTYIFSVMLLAFLIGIGLGSKLGGSLADRLYKAGGQAGVLYAFAAIEIGIALMCYAMMYLYPELPFWYVWLFDWVGAAGQPEALWWLSLLLAGLIMTPPAILMGMHFPVAVRAVVGHDKKLGGPVGALYGANSLGGAAGAFVAGFVLLPNLGIQGTIAVAAVAGLVAGAVLLLPALGRLKRAWIPLPFAALAGLALLFLAHRPPWDPMLMTSGMYQYVTEFKDHSRQGILDYSLAPYELAYYEEGLSSVVTVARHKEGPDLWLAVDGKVDASTTNDMRTQTLLSLLSLQFVHEPEDILIVGLASGITAGAVSRVPGLSRLEVVELEPAVERAAQFFSAWNRDVLSDPRTQVVHNDARNHLLLAEPGSYDLVVSEPSNPWIAGVASLFTREFLELGKSRLKPGGVWSQWIPVYGMSSLDLQTLLRTFREVYPSVLIYAAVDYGDLVLIGSESPLNPTLENARNLVDEPALAEELGEIGIGSSLDLLSLFLLDDRDILVMGDEIPVNTDDNMIIEYSAPKSLHAMTRAENFNLLLRHARLPTDSAAMEPGHWAALAQSYWQRGDMARAAAAMALARTSAAPAE